MDARGPTSKRVRARQAAYPQLTAPAIVKAKSQTTSALTRELAPAASAASTIEPPSTNPKFNVDANRPTTPQNITDCIALNPPPSPPPPPPPTPPPPAPLYFLMFSFDFLIFP